LPIGVQVLAPALKDTVMFQAAATLERHMQNEQGGAV
jgi:Asp-tRNA(Asn)/Glu-tRNA(Gln) amidotransferase A subunit family amidase